MEVIKPGKQPADWSKELKCSNNECEAEYRVKTSDLYWKSVSDGEGSSYNTPVFCCPNCTHEIEVTGVPRHTKLSYSQKEWQLKNEQEFKTRYDHAKGLNEMRRFLD